MIENPKSTYFLLWSILFVGLAIMGGVNAYSPVPYMDMWNGYLEFYVKVASGDWSAWWAQHNEHRIVLARLFFWIDFVLFEGHGWFLIVVNYLLLSLVCVLFWIIWKKIKNPEHNWMGYFLICWLFWWIQDDNLHWGFQSQFILAYLLPLAGLYFLHRSVQENAGGEKYFFWALILGVLSVGSMANGVLVLPIMTAYAVLTRMNRKRVGIMGVASLAALVLYFYGYISPAAHSTFQQAITINPIGLVQYVFVYLGVPFSFGDSHGGFYTAAVAGVLFVGSALFFAWKLIPQAKNNSLPFALLCFVTYVGATAVATAGGRLIFGVEQAITSRYMTPTLMAWTALLFLYFPKINELNICAKDKLWRYFAILLLLMFAKQIQAVQSKKAVLFERVVAALALEIGVKDRSQISNVFPWGDLVMSISEISAKNDLSIFGIPPIKDAQLKINSKLNIKINDANQCQGSVDHVYKIHDKENYLKLKGWLFDKVANNSAPAAFVVDENDLIHGVVLIGGERFDVADAIKKEALYSGFSGYMRAGIHAKSLRLVSSDGACWMPIT